MHDVFRVLRTAGSALSTQRLRLNVIANNIANVNTTRTDEGGAYQRRRIVVEPKEKGFQLQLPPSFTAANTLGPDDGIAGVEATRILIDDAPGPRVYEPGHPDADANGYVEYPNVDVVTEMTDMISATRSYQANVTVIDSIKQLAMKALEIGR